jgi:hypothetical protein
MPFPTTFVENLEISRLIAGSNWLMGYSHYSAAKDRWIKSYVTPERMVEVLSVFARNGINAFMSMQNPVLRDVLRQVKAETGVEMHWICTPSGEHVEDLMPGIEQSAEMGARICMPHQHWTDGNLVVNEQRLIGLEKVTERIRQLGMIPGLSTHRPETVVVCDKAGYDVATYIQLYNAIGFLCQVETDWIAKVISETPKPIMCIKPLAAGRLNPPTGFSFVYHSIKPIDMVTIGCLSPYEAEEDIQVARDILTGQQSAAHELTYSRSKAALKR